MPRLRVQDLLSSVAERHADSCAWREPVSFDVADGECLCVYGPSGVGKTLLLRAIADLDASRGQAWLDATERQELPAFEWRRQVAYVPAESAWWHARVGDHFPAPDAAALDALGLDPRQLERRVDELSTGERQRFALLRALAQRPRALLLDEPTAALDTASTRRVEKLLTVWREQNAAALVWVSHDAGQRRRLGDAGGRQLHFTTGGLRPPRRRGGAP